jgi:hypothetical protein
MIGLSFLHNPTLSLLFFPGTSHHAKILESALEYQMSWGAIDDEVVDH